MKLFLAGCFDVLSIGHINMLLFARQIAGPTGMVWVSIDSDDKIMSEKPSRPVYPLEKRITTLEALINNGARVVDVVFVHSTNDHLQNMIERLKPDYILVGSDYKNKPVVGSDIAEVIYFKRDERFSSTQIIKACQGKI